MVFASDPTQPVSYSTHLTGKTQAMDVAQVTGKRAKTHIDRSNVAFALLEGGQWMSDVALYQGWRNGSERGTAIYNYINTSIKTGPMLLAHGWKNGTSSYTLWRQNDAKDIPAELLSQVFPGLDEMVELAKETYEKTKVDLSAVKVLDVLRYVRQVFLEDAVSMRQLYPNFPAYKHMVFDTEVWREWSKDEPKRITEREQVYQMRNQMPDTKDLLVSMMEEGAREREAW